MPATRKNPFASAARYRVVSFDVPADTVLEAEAAFEDVVESVSSFEVESDKTHWHVELILRPEADESEIAKRCKQIEKKLLTPAKIGILEQKDWVSEIAKSFPAFRVGRFYVHGSHVKEPPPAATIPLHIDAGMAFGSGEHATTSGCLLAIERLARRRKFARMLDMGTGSGILAIALAKRFRKKVTAVDLDLTSVAVAHDNGRINRVTRYLQCTAQDGYRGRLTHRKKYDLIVANILARPLCRMAPALKCSLGKRGVVILSGLLAIQERQVLSAHRVQNLRLLHRIKRDGWHTLVLGR